MDNKNQVNRLRLLIITDYYYPHWTGIVKSIYNLSSVLSSKYQITILTVQYDKKLKQDEILKGTRIIRTKTLFTFSRVKYSLSLVSAAIKQINCCDTVLINTPCSNILPLAILTKIFKKKLLIFHQGDLILPKNIINHLIEIVFDLSTKTAFMLADKVSTYTQDYANHSRVLKPFLSKFTPVLMPVIFPLLNDEYINSTPIKELNLLKNQKKILFGFAGRFVEEKGFDILLKAIPLVMKKLPQAHFVYAGQVKMNYENHFAQVQHLYNKVKNNVTILGLLNDQEMLKFYKAIDYIIIPSRSDCFNLVQAEAMLMGKPAITSNIPGVRYIIQTTHFGLLFESKNYYDLANKIINITQNHYQEFHIKVKQLLNYEHITKSTERFIRN